MKKPFLFLAAVLLVLGCALPLAGYYLGLAALRPASGTPPIPQSPPSASAPESAAPEQEPGGLAGLLPERAGGGTGAGDRIFLIEDQSTGEVLSVPARDYLIGALASEMPVSWPDEALKAQAVAAHSYVLYCKNHANTADAGGAWLSADPARRQGFLTDAVLHSYWGTDYEANYARLSALVDEVLDEVLYYQGEPAGASYFAISNGRTEASENVWGTALPYLCSVDSALDTAADNYEYSVTFTQPQMDSALAAGLGIDPAGRAPDAYFGAVTYTPAGYVAAIDVCGTSVKGTTLRSVLALRSACFSVRWEGDHFTVTTRGYGHGVGLSQWGAKGLAEQGQTHAEILAHYFPGTVLGVDSE